MGLIDELNIGNEIVELYNSGKSPKDIQDILLQKYGGVIPSVATIYNYLKKYKLDEDTAELTLSAKKDIQVLEEKLDELFNEISGSLIQGRQKQLNTLRKDYERRLQIFFDFYSTKDEEIDDLLIGWVNTLDELMCSKCHDTVIPKLKESL